MQYKYISHYQLVFVKMARKNVTTDDLDGQKKYDPEPYFELLDLYFQKNKQIPVKHHIDSFNQFIEEMIPKIIQGSDNVISEKLTDTLNIRYRLTFDDFGLLPQTSDNGEKLMYPIDALQKNLSYSSPYTATITQWQDITDINTGRTTSKIVHGPEKNVPFAKIPIMVGSSSCNTTRKPDINKKQCKYDTGGYFIINGNEKVVLSVESVVPRRPLVFTRKDQNSLTYYVKVNSRPATQFTGNIQTFTILRKKDGSLVLQIPWFKEISIFTLMRALGMETDEDITNCILDPAIEKTMLNELSISMNAKNAPSLTREEAIETLMNNFRSSKTYTDINPEIALEQKRNHLMKILSQYILPHVTSGGDSQDLDMLYKAYFIGRMIHKLLKGYLTGTAISKETDENKGVDDRDSMVNKRVELSGNLLGALFDQLFKKMLNDCSKIFKVKNADDTKPPNIINHIKPNTIEQGLRQALSTGSFGTNTTKGLSQMLNRMNHSHFTSSMRRLITPTADASTNKLTGPRHLHNTQFPSLDPLETPEGPKTGIVKNMALLTNVTINLSASQEPIIKRYLNGKVITLDQIDKRKYHRFVKVFINEAPYGITDKVFQIKSQLREMRFIGEIDKTVSFVFDTFSNEFHIYTDGGRLIRPYLTVTNNKLNFKPSMLDAVTTWDEFLAKYPNVIEFLDKEEEQHMMLAIFPEYLDKARYTIENSKGRTEAEIDKINRTNRYDDNVFVRYSHCEINPAMMLGLISSNIPFPDHNQSPRGIFQYNQARQAMGMYASNYRHRIDTSYILYHPQIPIVTSRASKYTGSHIFPAGENIIVAIASYTG